VRDQPTLNILIYFPYLAPWLSDNSPHPGLPFPFDVAPHPPNDLVEYREFVEAVLRYLVETLGFPPERIVVEAMNEPDLRCGQDPVVACFWENWTMDDIAAVVRVTHEAILSVNAEIPLVGLAECCGTSVVRDLLDDYPEGAYLDGLSYHYYSPSGYNLNAALSRASALAPYGRPICVDEYGSLQYLSEGVDGALWHSWALATLWEAGIAPLQHPISEWPLAGEPYNSMGLFEDWRGDWTRKPAYWVYANFFAHFGGSQIISHIAPAGVDVVVGRRSLGSDQAKVAFWLTNRSNVTLTDQSFAVHNFVSDTATLRIYDNLVGPTPVLTTTVSGSPLVFTATLPAYSSHAFVLSDGQSHGSLDHVVLAPESATRMAGQTISYTLTAYDTYDNDWDVTVSGTYTITPDAGGSWAGNIYTTEAAGAWIVTATVDGASGNASLTIQRGTATTVNLALASETVTAGDAVTYAVWATDAHGNVWDATSEASYAIDSGAGGSWMGNVYMAQYAGTWTVTATVDATDGAATLTVTRGPAAEMTLTPDPMTITAGEAVIYTLTAGDGYGNNWDATAAAVYTITHGAGGSWADNVYTSQIAGMWTVTGSYSGQSEFASLTVNHASLTHEDLAPESATRAAGQTISYTLTAYDAYGNDWDVTASGAYTIEWGAGGNWACNVYTTDVTGTWIVTGTYGGQSDIATLTVWMPAACVYLPLILREDILSWSDPFATWGRLTPSSK
jgi:hypothetical protein